MANLHVFAGRGHAIEYRLVDLGIGPFDDAKDQESDVAMTIEDMRQGQRRGDR